MRTASDHVLNLSRPLIATVDVRQLHRFFQAAQSDYQSDEPWNSPENRLIADTIGELYAFNLQKNLENRWTTRFVAIDDSRGLLGNRGHAYARDVIPDGAPNTLLLIDLPEVGVEVFEPEDVSLDQLKQMFGAELPLSNDFTRRALLFGDGNTLWQAKPISIEILEAISTCNGGERVSRNELVRQGVLSEHSGE